MPRASGSWLDAWVFSSAWVAASSAALCTASGPRHVGWVLAVVGATVAANAIASNARTSTMGGKGDLRDGEAVTARFGADVPLRLARGCALAGCGAALLAPAPVRPLVCVPLTTLAALAGYRREERYGLVVVDGALLAGALLALPGWWWL